MWYIYLSGLISKCRKQIEKEEEEKEKLDLTTLKVNEL